LLLEKKVANLPAGSQGKAEPSRRIGTAFRNLTASITSYRTTSLPARRQDGMKYLCCTLDPRGFGGVGAQNESCKRFAGKIQCERVLSSYEAIA